MNVTEGLRHKPGDVLRVESTGCVIRVQVEREGKDTIIFEGVYGEPAPFVIYQTKEASK